MFKNLKTLTLLCTGLALLSPAPAQAGATLKIATLAPDGIAFTAELRKAAKEIAKKTSGRVKIKIYPGGVQGNGQVILRKMQRGFLDASTFTAGEASRIDRNFQIMSLPLILQQHKQVDAVRKVFDPLLMARMEQKGFIAMGVIEAGFIYLMSDKAINHPGGLKGRKIWIPAGDPIGQAVFNAAGVPPIPQALPDVLTSLQTGVLDTVCNSAVGAVVLQWFTKVKYITEHPLIYGYGTFLISKRSWNKIPAQDRPVVREIFARACRKIDKKNRVDAKAAMKTLQKEGLKLIPLRAGALGPMQKIADKAIARLVKKGLFDKALLQKIIDLAGTHK